ncbi:hypothetical protein VP01_1910g2 [Puccinia sorghi]|uniref:Uncharacterized protein n=1 Tax=Puccinia sorghi TaxID=27349 RepID=A0A0L6VDA3_9BASI|nr:hypothetical protein VP01_1910g2 [Puccinia sorghi]
MRLNFRRLLRPHRKRKCVVKTLGRAHPPLLRTLFLVSATACTFLANLTICQRSGGQFFTPGLLIVNRPAPDSKKPAGERMSLSLEITGDGILKPSNTDAGTQLATAILGLEIYLTNKDRNITISQGPELIQGERGSSVKHMDFVIPEVNVHHLEIIRFQVIFHEVRIVFLLFHRDCLGRHPLKCCVNLKLDRINGKPFYSIYSLQIAFHVLKAEEGEGAKDAGEEECNFPASQAELKDSRPSKQPFIKKGQTGMHSVSSYKKARCHYLSATTSLYPKLQW